MRASVKRQSWRVPWSEANKGLEVLQRAQRIPKPRVGAMGNPHTFSGR